MPEFRWTGTNKQGRTLSGTISAANRKEAQDLLEKRGVTAPKLASKGLDLSKFGQFGSGINDKQLATFTRQFATMINAGLPLVNCLQILSRQQDNKTFQTVILDVEQEVEKGGTLADAMARHNGIFNDLYVNMVSAGEQGGILDTILARLATHLEKSASLRSKIKTAMIYPLVVTIVLLVVITVMLVFIIPIFEAMFSDMGADLPGPTKVVVALSQFVTKYILLILAAAAGLVIAYKSWYKTESGQRVIDQIKLSMPIFGQLQRKMAIARFTRTLGTLVSSGVAILDGLSITSKTAGNKVVADAIMTARTSISGGENISHPLEVSGVFPSMVTSMIAVGEETGGLDDMLLKIADFYEEEVDVAVSGLTSTIEPLMIVVLGIVVGGMVIAMYLPIFNVVGAVGSQ